VKDNKLLEALGRVAREQQEREGLDKRWDALSAGKLSDDEEKQLRAAAEESSEMKAAYEAFRPLGAGFTARMVQRLEAETRPESEATPDDAGSNVVSLSSRRRRIWPPMALAASVLVAVGLVVMNQPADLPGYGIDLQGQSQTMRSGTGPGAEDRLIFNEGNRFRLVLTPATSVDGDLATRVLLDAGGQLTPAIVPAPQISGEGAVMIQGIVGHDVRLPKGEATLLVAVGRAGALPGDQELARRLQDTSTVRESDWSGWRIVLAVD